MNVLILFGVIEFIDDEAIVHSVSDAQFMSMEEADEHASYSLLDWIAPHYCGHRITFHQHAKETSWTTQ
jgi:hypothetical protein